jgi:SAM-dependent methyltransferase
MSHPVEHLSTDQWKKFYDAHAPEANFFEMSPKSWGYFKRSYRNYRIMRWLTSRVATRGVFLDAGAGSGLASVVAARHGFHPLSLDISEIKLRQLQAATQRERLDRTIRIALADLNKIPCDDASIDVINSQEVVEHIEEPLPLIHEFNRVLKRDGVMVISTPYRENLKQQVCPNCGFHFHPAGHFHSFDEKSIARLFAEGGFELMGFFTLFLPGTWRARRTLKAGYALLSAYESAAERAGKRGTAAAFFFRKAKRS